MAETKNKEPAWDWRRAVIEMTHFGSPEAVTKLVLDEYPGCASPDAVLRGAQYAYGFHQARRVVLVEGTASADCWECGDG